MQAQLRLAIEDPLGCMPDAGTNIISQHAHSFRLSDSKQAAQVVSRTPLVPAQCRSSPVMLPMFQGQFPLPAASRFPSSLSLALTVAL